MQEILIVVDMQKDFIEGALGTPEAQAVVPAAGGKNPRFPRPCYFHPGYARGKLHGQPGRAPCSPCPHCIKGSPGWQLCSELQPLCNDAPIDKPGFGSVALGELLLAADREEPISSVTLIGLCTDICVISNALLLKAFLPETRVIVDAACCAGVSPKATAARWKP